MAGVIHIGLRFAKDEFAWTLFDLTDFGVHIFLQRKSTSWKFFLYQPVEEEESGIVPSEFVFFARVSQADNECGHVIVERIW